MEPDVPAPEPGPHLESRAPIPAEPLVRRGLVPTPLLDPDAVFVVKRLQRNGHEAYLVGGCVRDLLAGLEPKDFDVATDAHPSRIKRLFHSARIIGRRFRLVHVRFPGDHVVETATFRGDPGLQEPEGEGGRAAAPRGAERFGAENVFGTAAEDAWRRDFTINALFYDPVGDAVIDWVGGLHDLEARVVRSIGEPRRRIAEDPVRMIRAVHFAERLEFALEPSLEASIAEEAGRIAEASGARLYVELLKILARGRARPTLRRLFGLGVLAGWIPELARWLAQPMSWPTREGGTHEEASRGEPDDLPAAHATWNLLGAADRFGLAAHGAPESLVLAPLLGPWVLETWRLSGGGGYPAFHDHVERVLRPLALRMSLPRWVQARLRDVLWMLLELREGPGGPRRRRLFHRPGFAEALTLLRMDLAARDADDELLEAWIASAEDLGVGTELASSQVARQEALDGLGPEQRRRGRRGRGSRQGSGAREVPEIPGDGRAGPAGIPPLPEEADEFGPPPDPAPVHGPPVLRRPPPAPEPGGPARPARVEERAGPPQPRPAAQHPDRPEPRPLLADDDFAAGLA